MSSTSTPSQNNPSPTRSPITAFPQLLPPSGFQPDNQDKNSQKAFTLSKETDAMVLSSFSNSCIFVLPFFSLFLKTVNLSDISGSINIRPVTRAGVDQFKKSSNNLIWGKSAIYLCKDPMNPGKYLIVDGNHRITALRELYDATKDPKYVLFVYFWIVSLFFFCSHSHDFRQPFQPVFFEAITMPKKGLSQNYTFLVLVNTRLSISFLQII